ncbi:class B sortase [Clostridium perfringens]|nr:class B sortase [Clostridium perfringens]
MKISKIIKKITTVILILIILFCVIQIYNKYLGYYLDSNNYENLRTFSPSNIDSDDENEKNLKNINPDYIFWIRVDGTNIDFPVVQGTDNDFYLHHRFNKEKGFSGSIFVDSENNINTDANIVIYGHNMRNDTMFAQLKYFENQNFFNNNKYITLYKHGKQIKFEIFSVYSSKAEKFALELKLNFQNKELYEEYLKEQADKSLFKRDGIDLQADSRIITLFTCSYEFDDARIAVVAKEV